LIDDEVTLADSTVICEYLEDRYPTPALHPRGPAQRARARWIEEFADTRMGDVFIWRLFHQVVIRPAVFGETGDAELVQRTLEQDIPQVLDYLESQIPSEGFLFGELALADVAVAAFFRTAAFARFHVDALRWPQTAAYVERVLALEAFARLRPFEDRSRRTPPAEHRRALAEIGAPIMDESHTTDRPRRGVLSV
jgi:glutathione S-transferase